MYTSNVPWFSTLQQGQNGIVTAFKHFLPETLLI